MSGVNHTATQGDASLLEVTARQRPALFRGRCKLLYSWVTWFQAASDTSSLQHTTPITSADFDALWSAIWKKAAPSLRRPAELGGNLMSTNQPLRPGSAPPCM